jgi:hypothetical protein
LKTSALITIDVTYRSAEDSAKFAKTAVKLYSLREQDYINTMRFRSEVYSILCSKRMLVVVRAPPFPFVSRIKQCLRRSSLLLLCPMCANCAGAGTRV